MLRSIRFVLPVLLLSTSVSHAAFDACRDYFPNQTPPKVSASPAPTRDICFND